MRFVLAPGLTPLHWHFRYAQGVLLWLRPKFRVRADFETETGADDTMVSHAPAAFGGMGKRSRQEDYGYQVHDYQVYNNDRSREDEKQEGGYARHEYKRSKMSGGLGGEFARGNAASSVQNEPIELFPERIGALYGERPFYGRFH